MKTFLKIMILALVAIEISAAQEMTAVGQGGVIMDRAGQTSMNFLQVGISPRIAGRGNVYTTLGKGAESVFGNPVGITEMTTKFEGFVSSTRWFADIQYIGAAIAWNGEEYGAVGLHFVTVDYGTIKGAALPDANVGDDNYILTGDVSNVGAYSVGLTYAKQINPKFSIGGTLKYVAQQLGYLTYADGTKEENDKGKLAADLGLRYYPGWSGLCLAMTMRNFSTYVRYQTQSFSLPLTYSLGVSLDLLQVFGTSTQKHNLYVATEYVHPNNHSARMNGGVEYIFDNMVTLRAGYESNHDILSWSLGAGLSQNIEGILVSFDYSYSDTEIFNGVNRIGVSIGF